MYVILPNFESGGKYFSQLFSWTMVAMLLFQLTIIGIIGLKKALAPALVTVPLLPLTIAFWIYCKTYMEAKALNLPAFEAAKKDDDAVEPPSDGYIQPALLAPMQPDFVETQPTQHDLEEAIITTISV